VAAVASSLSALLMAIYWAPLAAVFGTSPLDGPQWIVVLIAGGLGEVLVAVRRFVLFKRPLRVRRESQEEA